MNIKRKMRKVVNNVRRTIKNKLCAIGLIIIGLLSLRIDGDGTFLLLTILIGLGLIFIEEDIFQR